ncbi:oxygenase MpaB family protein [Catalinimonas alkaloidigena]|uniref:oxygenase MpaB family protein n=1 Tax=Catalinimonas alkaloidigena TaxID=1075417 RepID=UPI0024065C91|nr:oxygenase MpaB family protein [Catalinimonas alkaloidigena]
MKTDPPADKAVAAIFKSEQSSLFRELVNNLNQNNYDIPENLPSEVKLFLKQSRKLPIWADYQRIEQAQTFFKKHASTLSLMLAFMSLPYDYAAANGAQVLLMSERMQHDTAKRLLETGKFVFDVASRGSFETDGSAISSVQKVRLIHASIRYHISRSARWNKQWGEPINQEDMAGTNLSFSLIPIRGMRKLGYNITKAESEAYIHLWNVASYIMGVDEILLADTSKEAFILDKMISNRQFATSEAGISLTKALLAYIDTNTDSTLQWLAPKYMRFLLGDKIADILHVPKPYLPDSYMLRPLKHWNQIKSLFGGYSDTYLQAKGQMNNQIKMNELKKVSINIPEALSK